MSIRQGGEVEQLCLFASGKEPECWSCSYMPWHAPAHFIWRANITATWRSAGLLRAIIRSIASIQQPPASLCRWSIVYQMFLDRPQPHPHLADSFDIVSQSIHALAALFGGTHHFYYCFSNILNVLPMSLWAMFLNISQDSIPRNVIHVSWSRIISTF